MEAQNCKSTKGEGRNTRMKKMKKQDSEKLFIIMTFFFGKNCSSRRMFFYSNNAPTQNFEMNILILSRFRKQKQQK